MSSRLLGVSRPSKMHALTAEVQANRVKTQAEAIAFLDGESKGAIPADAFVALLKERVGKATWADTLAAEKEEDIGIAAVAEIIDGKVK
jgi:hypothetical protein